MSRRIQCNNGFLLISTRRNATLNIVNYGFVLGSWFISQNTDFTRKCFSVWRLAISRANKIIWTTITKDWRARYAAISERCDLMWSSFRKIQILPAKRMYTSSLFLLFTKWGQHLLSYGLASWCPGLMQVDASLQNQNLLTWPNGFASRLASLMTPVAKSRRFRAYSDYLRSAWVAKGWKTYVNSSTCVRICARAKQETIT